MMKILTRRRLVWGLLALVLLACWGRYLIYWDHPYCGLVLDEESGEPIRGVVVAASYSLVTPTWAGDIGSYVTCKEVVTDQQGRFRLPILVSAKPWGLISYLDKGPGMIAFKRGYETITIGPAECNNCCSDDGLVFRTRRLKTLEELRDNSSYDNSRYPPNKCPELWRMEAEARTAAGLDP